MVPVSKHQVWSPLEPIEGLLSILPRLRRRCLGLLVVCVRECLFACMRVGMHARCVYLRLCVLCLHYICMYISTSVPGAVIPLEVERLVQASGGAVCKETQHYNASRCDMYKLLAVHFQRCACVRAVCLVCVCLSLYGDMITDTHRPGPFSTQFRATPTFERNGCRGTNCESKNATPLARRGRGVLTDHGGGAGVDTRVLGIRMLLCFPQEKDKGPLINRDLLLRESGVWRERSGADTTHQTASMCVGEVDRGGGAPGGGGSGLAGAVLPHLQSEL